MFSPNADPPAAPKSAPFISIMGTSSDAFFEEMRATDDTTKGVMGAMIRVLAEATESRRTLSAALVENCVAMFKPGAAEAYNTFIGTAESDPMIPDDHLRALVEANLASCVTWICDLVNASKKKELTGENVEGYFAALGRSSVKGASVATLINKAADFLPDDILNAAFRTALTQNKWNEYHTSRVSTGKVISKFAHIFIGLGIMEEGGAEDLAIRNCADNSHNVALSAGIPDRIIGYAALYLEVCGTPIANWRQGKRCQDSLPNSKVQSIKAVFKKYNELIYNVSGVDAATSVQALKQGIPENFW
jgi:hypothetical protein